MVNSLFLALAITAFSTLSQAADISECNLKKTADDRAECMASYSGSAAFCDKIQSWERRQHCIRGVIRKQRQLR